MKKKTKPQREKETVYLVKNIAPKTSKPPVKIGTGENAIWVR